MQIPQNNQLKASITFQLHINNELIREVHHVKYLGITIDSHLTWREHVNVLSHKASATLALLRCNLKPCSSHIKSMNYLCYVRSMVKYSSTIWDPHINNHNLTDSVTSMLQSLKYIYI